VPTEYDQSLFNQLRAKRKALAEAAELPPYIIFADRTLIEMATYYPQSRESLFRLYGVGEVKLDKYAAAFLPVIQAYCREQGLEEKQKPGSVPVPATSAGNRTSDVATLYNTGQSIADVAASYGVKERTVINHLWKAARAGEQLRPGGFLEHSQISAVKQEAVLAAFGELGVDFLRPVYEALNATVSYDELDLLRLHLVSTKSDFYPGKEIDTEKVQEAIIACVATIPGELPRSGVAKILTGSKSKRISNYQDHPLYGSLQDIGKQVILKQIDEMLDNGKLKFNGKRYLLLN
jgi:hypothetical protein